MENPELVVGLSHKLEETVDYIEKEQRELLTAQPSEGNKDRKLHLSLLSMFYKLCK